MSGQNDHLRGKDGRSAEDAGHGDPRPDEDQQAADRPTAIQATHGGRPVNSPLTERHEDTGAGRDSDLTGAGGGGRSRYSGSGRETEGAFGEEEPE